MTGGASIPFYVTILLIPVRVGLLFLLTSIPSINIFGAVIANTVYLLIVNIVLVVYIKRKINLKYSLYYHLLKPIIIGVVCLLIGATLYGLIDKVSNYLVAMIVAAVVILLLYLFWIYFGKVLTAREKKYFIIKRKIIKK